jgi:glucose/arabinose dehydrogenase
MEDSPMSDDPVPSRRRPTARRALVVAAAAVLAVLPAALAAPLPEEPTATLADAWPGVAFARPMGISHAPGGDTLYVFEQAGKILKIDKWRGQGPVSPPQPFLDLTGAAFARFQGGVLGLAFHPDHATNGRFFVCYLAETRADPPFQIVVSEFASKDGVADPRSQRAVLQIPKSRPNHNAGCLAFGPDGMLYVSTGDNQVPEEAVTLTSQNPNSLLGKILRIDVNRTDPGLAYAIPADNPWAGAQQGVRREIWAYGFRNPWRFSFDAEGRLWTAEPGTTGVDCREWVTLVQRGENHGWPFFEGTKPHLPVPANLRGAKFVQPVFEYARAADENTTAGVGGFVYRGDRVKPLQGQYVFGDNGRGEVYVISVAGGRGSGHRRIGAVKGLSSIGQDGQGELYFASLEEGRVYTMVPR